MIKTTWLALFLLLYAGNTVVAMDPTSPRLRRDTNHAKASEKQRRMDTKGVSKRWQEMATVLPDLVKYDGLSISQGNYSVMSFGTIRKKAYLIALQPESLHRLDALEQIAAPLDVSHDELIGGAWKKRNGEQEFRLARLARGVLLQCQGDSDGAEHEFKEVERSVDKLLSSQKSKYSLASCEKSIGHAASCCRFLMNNQHDQAFGELLKLKELSGVYPCWKRFVTKQCQMLADAQYLLAIATLQELAQEGVVDAQFHIAQNACAQAVTSQDIEAQCSHIKVLVPYFESLVQHPEYNALAESLMQYTAAAHSYENKQFSQSTQLLVELLRSSQEAVALKDINQLAECLLDAVALQGDVRARCYIIPQLLQSTQQKVRRTGIERTAVLMQELICAGEKCQLARLDEFGLVTQLEDMAKTNNGTACVLLAQWKCYQALADMVSTENAEATKARHQIVKLYAELGCKHTKQQPELLKTIIRYANGVVALCEGNLEAAAKQFIAVVDTGTSQHALDGKIRTRASQFLIELKDKGEWRARCRYILQCVRQDGKKITAETQVQCCTLTADFLERAPKQLYKQECGAQLVTALNDVVALGNAQAQYLMSCLQFRLIHDKHEKTGLDDASMPKLDQVFSLAGAASKAGLKEATPFVKVVMQYRGAHGLLKKELYDNAAEQLLGLLDVPLRETDKALCKAFAEHHLIKLAHAGNLGAGGWHVATLLETGDKEEIVKGIAVCGRIFGGFLEQGVAQVDVEKWQKALSPFKKFQIMEKLEKILSNEKFTHLHADVAFVLSMGYLLQAMIPYRFMADDAEQQTVVLLTSSVERAKQACERGPRQNLPFFREQLGLAYYRLGHYYLENNNISDAMDALCEGSRLQHPGCMRAASVLALEQPADEQIMDERMFKAHIATIERAYNMGDQEAGAILAEHYYDGPANPFGCGHFLEKDLKKSVILSNAIGSIYPQTACILGYYLFCQLTDPKEKGKKIDISGPVKLLMDAAAGRQLRAYGHLQEICLSSWCTQEMAQRIVQFLELKAGEHVPEALCALGTILIKDLRYVDDAIQYFQEATRFSNGMLGHFELAKVYATLECKGKKEICKAAKHCIAMMDARAGRKGAPAEHARLTAFILDLLRGFKGTAEEKQHADELLRIIQEKLAAEGVCVVEKDQATPRDTQQVNVRRVDNPDEVQAVEVHKNSTNAVVRTTLVDKAQVFVDAIIDAARDLTGDRTNKAYMEQYERAYYQFFHHLKTTVIPETVVEQPALTEVLEAVNRVLEVLTSFQGELCTPNIQKIEKEAFACIKSLACRGCVPALAMYVKTHLYANDAAQDDVLEIMCDCFSVLSGHGSVVWQESGIMPALQLHIEHIVKLVESKKSGPGALALSFWYAAQYEQTPLDHDQAVSQTKTAIDCVWNYCNKSKEWGCKEAIPVWSMMRLSRPEPMSEEECKQALASLETVVNTNVSAAEFLIKLYREGGVLPCGYRVQIDYAHAKHIAQQVQHTSRLALMTLAVIAKESGEHEEFLEYALALYKKGAYSLGDLTENCIHYAVLPQSIVDHLEAEYKSGNMQTLRALVIIRSCLREFGKSIALLEDGIKRGSTAEYLELALLYLDPQFKECSVARSLEYLKLRLEAMKNEPCIVQDRGACLDRFAARLLFTMGIVAENQALKMQVLEAMDMVARYASEYIGDGYESVETLCMQMAYQCNHESFDYQQLLATFKRMIVLSKAHPKAQDRDNILCVSLIIVKKHQELLQNRKVSKKILSQAEEQLCQMLVEADIDIKIIAKKK